MSVAPTAPPLPQPTRLRWQPLRLGLIELYHYDVEEFWFRDGHLMLRGNNGTGKSKVLSLTLPFLLDADLSASRVEPDGDRTKRMDWNLLMNKRHDRRIGYTWLEFGRLDAAGTVHTVTLGCGLRAVAGRSSTDAWFFITDQRIGAELWLTTPEHTALTRERLIEALGAHGQVYATARDYRRAVDEKLFRLGTERYDALVDTLIQLRQPQLSRDPDEKLLSDALTSALRPLDRAALEDVAEAMSELSDLRREVVEIEAMRKAVGSFGNRYRRYAQVATRRRARTLRQAETDFDNASRDVNGARTALDAARARVAVLQSRQQALDEQLAAGSARLAVLRADPVMRDAARLSTARERLKEYRGLTEAAAGRERQARTRLEHETAALDRRRGQADASRSALQDATCSAAGLARDGGVDEIHARALEGVVLPDGIGGLSAAALTVPLREGRAGIARRREAIAVIRQRLRAADIALHARSRAQDARGLHATAFDAASTAARAAAERLRERSARQLEAWRQYATAAHALRLPDLDTALDEFGLWIGSLHGANPLRVALDGARQRSDAAFAGRDAELAAGRRLLDAERTELEAERHRLDAGEDRPPPPPHTRDPAVRAQSAGAPLWQLLDFASHVPAAARAGLEAALEAAGLLDAWVLPEGTLIDRQTHDVILTARAPCAESLAAWLVPTIPALGNAAAVETGTLSALLASVACSIDEPAAADTWVSPTGAFRIGALRGAWHKPVAHFIGHAAREAARHSRLAAIAVRRHELGLALEDQRTTAERLAADRAAARDEYARAPTDDELRRGHADNDATERRRRDAQEQLGEAESKLALADAAVRAAQEELAADARDLRLPAEAVALAMLESSLNEYGLALAQLSNTLCQHQAALVELADQMRRADQADGELRVAAEEHREQQLQLGVAAETAATLQATVGQQVSELLGDIETAEQARSEADRALKATRAHLVVAAGERGTAENHHATLEARLAERVQSRKSAVSGLQAYATDTGFVGVAVPDLELPDASAPWSLEAALTVARRAEQSLAEVAADDDDWKRLQSAIGTDFQELQSTMSLQGHSATAEPSDHGLIVRIVYQQRPERPDLLERRLDAELAEQRLILSAQERALLEEHLEKEIAANLQRMIRDTDAWVAAIDVELYKRPTSTGMRYRLDWNPLPENDANAVSGLELVRKRLLNTSAEAWSADDRRLVGEFLQARIDAERQRDEGGTLYDSLARALDYRRWHRFSVLRHQDRQWKPLSGPASSGERALGLTVPLFAAASSHYSSAHEHAPRLVLLDEAFAGIDDEARAGCMSLIHEFDLDFVMTSEREWGCYAELPGLSICQIVRRDGMDAVFVSRWSWDGRELRASEEPARRFPDAGPDT